MTCWLLASSTGRSNRILGVLRKEASFDASEKKVSDLDGSEVARTEIQGRALLEGGLCIGYPAFFNTVAGDTDYQMVLIQDRGDGNPNLIAWFDTNELDGQLRLDNTGTLVVRPGPTNHSPMVCQRRPDCG